ncbi:hypothetical protein ACIQ6R_19135 [Streptomyces sp. NPDC096048]|uniref:hypothetical protein n=1 Tax=Streptomyces sp. NPDC096048 TaxID=3366072 RepID=UPI00382B33C7
MATPPSDPGSRHVVMHGNAHDAATVYQAVNMYIYEPGSAAQGAARPGTDATERLAERVIALAEQTRIRASFCITPYLHRPLIEHYVAQHTMEDDEKILVTFGSDPKTGKVRPDPYPDALRGPTYLLVTTYGIRWVSTRECGFLRYSDSDAWCVGEYSRRLPYPGSKGGYWPKHHGVRFTFDDGSVWLTGRSHWWRKARDVGLLAHFLTLVRDIGSEGS